MFKHFLSNGKSKRMIRTINNRTSILLHHASIPNVHWVYALWVSCYLHNIVPSKLLNNIFPFHILYRKVPLYSHLRVFGCLYFLNLTSITKYKLFFPLFTLYIYRIAHNGYLCFDLINHKLIIFRHVTFIESNFSFVKLLFSTFDFYNFLRSSEIPPLITHHLVTNLAQTTIIPSRRSMTSLD